MDREKVELLEKLQEFTNVAVKSLKAGDGDKASFYFNLSASIAGQLADKSKR